jgi:predicted PurR-regulated permease PerM
MNTRTTKPYTLDRVVRLIIAASLAVATGLLVNRLSEVLLPFLLAWLIAYLLYPIMGFFQYRLRFRNRILSIVATLTLVIGLLVLAGYILIPPIVDQSEKAGKLIAEFLKKPGEGWTLPPQLTQTIQDLLAKLDVESYLNFDTFEGFVKSVLPGLWNIITSASGIVLNVLVFFIVFLYLVFILLDYEKISTEWVHLIPKNYRNFVHRIGDDLKKGMNQYFRGQALISLMVGIGYAIGFSIIGLPMGIIFGLSVGVMHMIPYLQVVSLVPAVMLCAIKAAEYQQSFFWVLMSALAVYTVMQIIIELILTPKIMGRVMSMHPAIILLSLSIWGSLLGIIGMIIALPLTTILISYYRQFIIEREVIEDLVSLNRNEEEDSVEELVKSDEKL